MSVLLLYSIGRPKHVRVMAGGLEGDIFIGPKAEVRREAGREGKGGREGEREGRDGGS